MRTTAALFLFLLAASTTAVADSRIETQTYGTTSETALTIPMQAFEPNAASTGWNTTGGLKYVSTGTGCCVVAPVMLPAGASVNAVEIEGCDISNAGELVGGLLACPTPNGACDIAGSLAASGVTETTCGKYRANFVTPVTVDNVANTYAFTMQNNGDLTGIISFRAVRVFYKLQVSPAPATATFADVPVGHPFHRFVEALASAGITAGCGGGNFCPNAAVTRGQMAVFLSAALGLHFAP